MIDLTLLVTRLTQGCERTIVVFENGQRVVRNHATVYTDVKRTCEQLGAWGIKPGMRVGILAPNSYQWIVYDLALIELRAVSVAFVDDFSGVNVKELCDRYSLSLLLLSVANGVPDNCRDAPVAFLDGTNRTVTLLDRCSETRDQTFKTMGLAFSSGSSGGLKGLILDRKGVEVSLESFVEAIAPRHNDCLLLFLPMSNFQQRMMYYAALWYGFDLIVTDPSQIFRALKELRPTMLIAPPALYEAFATRFVNLPAWKRWMANIAGDIILWVPWRRARRKLGKLIFKQAHDAFGGRMRIVITGMAPIKRSTMKLFARLQLSLYETYGLIECGPISLNSRGDSKVGSVGHPLPGVKIELAPDGEIIAHRNPILASGYFECTQGEQERTFIGNNRVATGDIGRLDEDGYLYLIGRKKEMIITAGGDKVHPEVLEAEIDNCSDVLKSVICQDSDLPSLIAVIVTRNPEDLDARKRIQKVVDDVNEVNTSTPIGKVIITSVIFSRENGLLRPNLKLDRRKIAQHFQIKTSQDEIY